MSKFPTHLLYQDFRKDYPTCGLANKVWHYLATDTPNLWKKTDDKRIIEERAKSYTYKFNSQGLRCDDFNLDCELPIVFLGCSNTFGVGLELENTWTKILLEKITNQSNKKIPLWSLATPGSSIDLQALLLEKYFTSLKPKLIFFLIPNIYRRLLPINGDYVGYLLGNRKNQWRPDDVEKRVGKFDMLFTDEDFATFESFKNLLLINQLASSTGDTVFYDSWCDIRELHLIKSMCDQLSQFKFLAAPYVDDPYSRDGFHAGLTTHSNFAESIFKMIKNQL